MKNSFKPYSLVYIDTPRPRPYDGKIAIVLDDDTQNAVCHKLCNRNSNSILGNTDNDNYQRVMIGIPDTSCNGGDENMINYFSKRYIKANHLKLLDSADTNKEVKKMAAMYLAVTRESRMDGLLESKNFHEMYIWLKAYYKIWPKLWKFVCWYGLEICEVTHRDECCLASKLIGFKILQAIFDGSISSEAPSAKLNTTSFPCPIEDEDSDELARGYLCSALCKLSVQYKLETPARVFQYAEYIPQGTRYYHECMELVADYATCQRGVSPATTNEQCFFEYISDKKDKSSALFFRRKPSKITSPSLTLA